MKDEVFFDIEGKEHCNEELALAHLLEAEVLFCNERAYTCPLTGKTEPATVVLFVLCNDIFAWGCADAESFTKADIPMLYKLWQADKMWGPVKWVCLKRNEQPQAPVARDMKKAGAWDESMDRLERNYYDRRRANS